MRNEHCRGFPHGIDGTVNTKIMNPIHSFIMLDFYIIVILRLFSARGPNSRCCALILGRARWVKLPDRLTSILLNTPKLASAVARGVPQSLGPGTWYLICMNNYSSLFVCATNILTFCGVLVRTLGDRRTEGLMIHQVIHAPFAFCSH